MDSIVDSIESETVFGVDFEAKERDLVFAINN
jgi:hypothetical protein